jgi:hypothetical protein
MQRPCARSAPIRFVDLLWAVGVARIPIVIGAIANRLVVEDPQRLVRSAVEGQLDPTLLWIALVTLPMLGWMLLWLYFAYRTATGRRGARSGISFVAALIAAEIASKAILFAVAGMGV